MEVASLARVYAAKYIAIGSAKTVADELFQIMEVSIKTDSSAKQESTKEFLVKIMRITVSFIYICNLIIPWQQHTSSLTVN